MIMFVAIFVWFLCCCAFDDGDETNKNIEDGYDDDDAETKAPNGIPPMRLCCSLFRSLSRLCTLLPIWRPHIRTAASVAFFSFSAFLACFSPQISWVNKNMEHFLGDIFACLWNMRNYLFHVCARLLWNSLGWKTLSHACTDQVPVDCLRC